MPIEWPIEWQIDGHTSRTRIGRNNYAKGQALLFLLIAFLLFRCFFGHFLSVGRSVCGDWVGKCDNALPLPTRPRLIWPVYLALFPFMSQTTKKWWLQRNFKDCNLGHGSCELQTWSISFFLIHKLLESCINKLKKVKLIDSLSRAELQYYKDTVFFIYITE